jgi:hypothetical protein
MEYFQDDKKNLKTASVNNVNKEQIIISFLLNPYDLGISGLQAESWVFII